MKFAHFADLHIGHWRERNMQILHMKRLAESFQVCIDEKVECIVIAGDIFDVPLPSLELIEQTTDIFLSVKDAGIPIIVIGGSHDYSGKNSILNLLHKTKCIVLLEDGVPYLIPQTSYAITGVHGKIKSMEKDVYLEQSFIPVQDKYNIFLFHINLEDITEVPGEGIVSGQLPEGFDYYAGGHIHKQIYRKDKRIAFPSSLFPCSIGEFGDKHGFYIIEDEHVKYHEVEIAVAMITLHVDNKSPQEVLNELEQEIEKQMLEGVIVIIRLVGELAGIKKDIQLPIIVDQCYAKGAYHVLRSTRAMSTRQYALQETMGKHEMTLQEYTEKIINEKESMFEPEQENKLIQDILQMPLSKHEDETQATYEHRIKELLVHRFFELVEGSDKQDDSDSHKQETEELTNSE